MKRLVSSLTAAVAGLCVFGGVAAQVPPDIAARIKAAGPTIDPSIGQMYAPMFPKEPYPDAKVARDLAYGADPLQRLDVFAPAAAPARPAPVLMFVHGGGFVRGARRNPNSPFNDNVMLWALSQGMVGVNIDYRLAPKDPWPAGVQDLASAVAWTRANIAEHGGDPDRIFLFGHSAGANHVADFVQHPDRQGPAASSVKGAILLSPMYEAAPSTPHPYYGEDPLLRTSGRTIERMGRSRIPIFIGYAEYDPAPFKAYAPTLREGLTKSGRTPGFVYLKDHGHISEGLAVGTADVSLTGPLLQWMRAQP